MLTPQEVSGRAFSKAAFGGYNMAMVDEFLDELTDDYTSLYKENAALKAKLKVLVDKVEEYRATEDSMRAALLTAQRMANTMVEEAEEKTEADVNAIEEKILASFCPAAEEAAPEKTQETAPAEEQSAPKAEEPKAEPLEPDDSPFVETASHAIRLDDLKFGRNYHGEE